MEDDKNVLFENVVCKLNIKEGGGDNLHLDVNHNELYEE